MNPRIRSILLLTTAGLFLLPGATPTFDMHICGPDVIKLKKNETKTYVIGAGGNDTYYEVQSESNDEKVLVSPKTIIIATDGVFDVTGLEPGTNTIVFYWDSTRYDDELADGVCEVKVRVASPDVNSTGDADDVAPGDGMCDTDALIDRNGNEEMECTLRAAITESNATPGADSYMYRIPPTDPGAEGGGRFRISASSLPSVAAPLALDGTSVLAKSGQAAPPTSSITVSGSGLVYAAGSEGSDLKGHTIINATGPGVQIDASGVTIRANYIGTTTAGGATDGNGASGILINGDGNTIGGGSAADQNIIAGNTEYGIDIQGSNNTVQGNWIGVSGQSQAVPNMMGGIALNGDSNQIGGDASAAGEAPGNVVSGNEINESTAGIVINSDSNTLEGNIVGLD
ncbi:MAG: right-handed parallel beta-helix repeat-containing protein, partial [Rhodothermales bacterium]|nr:right-handed parallel beta-helix repeat-containing protein [Rhodothermales bacterium]